MIAPGSIRISITEPSQSQDNMYNPCDGIWYCNAFVYTQLSFHVGYFLGIFWLLSGYSLVTFFRGGGGVRVIIRVRVTVMQTVTVRVTVRVKVSATAKAKATVTVMLTVLCHNGGHVVQK